MLMRSMMSCRIQGITLTLRVRVGYQGQMKYTMVPYPYRMLMLPYPTSPLLCFVWGGIPHRGRGSALHTLPPHAKHKRGEVVPLDLSKEHNTPITTLPLWGPPYATVPPGGEVVPCMISLLSPTRMLSCRALAWVIPPPPTCIFMTPHVSHRTMFHPLCYYPLIRSIIPPFTTWQGTR